MRLSQLDETIINELIKMENNSDTSEFIVPYNYNKHLREINYSSNRYLGIYEKDQLLGFFILGIEQEGKRIEFRRIVIKQKGCGYGQKAIKELENYCIAFWNTKSIWLDVFDYNKRGIHVYEKTGYKKIDKKLLDGKRLIIMEKYLIKEN